MAAKRPSYQNRIGYHATLLGAFATLSCMVLLLGDMTTREIIADRMAEDMLTSLNQVIPSQLYDNDLLEEPVRLTYKDKPINVYRGIKDDQVTALAYQVSEYGYGGEIVLMMGLDHDGTILGVRVLSHAETPGLGDKMEMAKSGWVKGFDGLSAANTQASQWAVKKDGGRFDQFTGATITPRAIVRAVKSGLDFFQQHRRELTMLVRVDDAESAESATQVTDKPPQQGAQSDE